MVLTMSATAAPSIYPTGVTRYVPERAWNGYVLFTGQDKKTPVPVQDAGGKH
jgi:hypothetical protein